MNKVTDQQRKHNDCGISAVKTVYNLHNINVTRNYIEENIYLTENGSSLEDIKNFLDKETFNTQFNLLDLNTLKSDPKKFENYVPCIIPGKHSQGEHYVVISGIRNKKLEVLDPAMGDTHKWTFSELMKNAHTATANYDYVNSSQLLQKIISDELSAYGIDSDSDEVSAYDKADIINKLTYFSYIQENFGFSNREAEKKFLKDLLFNQELNTLPKQFRTMKLSGAKLRITAPVVLTVKNRDEARLPNNNVISTENPKNSYRKLISEMKPYQKLWGIYIASALFAAGLSQLTIFTNQILIDNILPSYNINLLVLFAIGVGIFKVFNLILSLFKSFISIHLSNILDNF